jgi:preprotein translocase subunit SecF
MLNMILNNCSVNEHILVFTVIAMIGFAVNETIVVTAQINSTNSDKQKIIVTWLETNDTKTIDTPMISISDEDFWKTFGPLLKQSINGP